MRHTTRIIGTATATVLAVSGIGAGIASAETAPTQQPGQQVEKQQTDAGKKDDKRAKHKPRIAHGEFTKAGKKHQVIAVQRGEVIEVAPTTITVRSTDGYVKRYEVSERTKIRDVKGKKQEQIGDVRKGEQVHIRADKDGDKLTAKRIGDRGAKR